MIAQRSTFHCVIALRVAVREVDARARKVRNDECMTSVVVARDRAHTCTRCVTAWRVDDDDSASSTYLNE
jgi:hypothetical protein